MRRFRLSWLSDAWNRSIDRAGVRMADSARFNSQTNSARRRVFERTVNELKFSGARYLNGTVGGHAKLSLVTWLVAESIAPRIPSLLATNAEVNCRGLPRLQAKDNKPASQWFSSCPSALARRPHDLLFREICSS